jgi:hypothetical protein
MVLIILNEFLLHPEKSKVSKYRRAWEKRATYNGDRLAK